MNRKYLIPVVKSIFESEVNPLNEHPNVQKALNYMYEYSLVPKHIWKKNENNTCFVKYFYPFCKDIGKYENLIKLMVWYQLMDDHTEYKWGDINRDPKNSTMIWSQVIQAVDRLLDTNQFIPMTKWKPYVFAFYAVLEKMLQDLDTTQQKRLAGALKKQASINIQETDIINGMGSGEVSKNQVDSVGLAFLMIEYANDIHLTDREWADPELQKYLSMASTSIMLSNDILSFEKELHESGCLERMSNNVSQTMLTNNCSTAEAMAKVYRLWFESEHRLLGLQKQLLSKPNSTEDWKRFVRSVRYVITGMIDATKETQRYNQYLDLK